LNGQNWAAIAAEYGQSAEQLRQKLNRAIHRVRQKLLRDETRADATLR
jgi:hypothetical protein